MADDASRLPQPPDDRPAGKRAAGDGRRPHVQEGLDDALADSFPASDPVSVATSQAEEDWGAEDEGAAAGEQGRGSERRRR